MACQQLIGHIQAAANFVAALPEHQRTSALGTQMAALRTMIGRIYGPVEALQAFNAIHASLGAFLSDPQKAELLALINVQGAIMQTGHGRTQEWSQDFWVRLPSDVHSGLSDNGQSSSARMLELFKYLASRGLRHPSERTFGAMLALYYYCAMRAPDSGPQLLASIRHLKTSWSSFIEAYKRTLQGADNFAWSWPGPPAGSQTVELDAQRFACLVGAIPLRNSNQRGMQAMADGDLRIVPAGRRGCQPRGMTLQNSMDRLAIMDGSHDSADSQSGGLSALPFGSAASAGAAAAIADVPATTLAPPAAAEGPPASISLPPAAENAGNGRRSLAQVTAEMMQVMRKPAAAAAAWTPKARAKKVLKKLAAATLKRPSNRMDAADSDGASDGTAADGEGDELS